MSRDADFLQMESNYNNVTGLKGKSRIRSHHIVYNTTNRGIIQSEYTVSVLIACSCVDTYAVWYQYQQQTDTQQGKTSSV